MSSKNLVQKVRGLNLVEHITIVDIILAPDGIDLLLDEIFFIRSEFLFGLVIVNNFNRLTHDLLR